MDLSFVIPAYNEEALIARCLDSVLREIARVKKERPDLTVEVVVVNNNSTDRTKAIAQSFAGVRVVDEPHKGLVRARKAGYEATTGALVANIDADTVVPRGWLSTVLSAFARSKKMVALSGPYIYTDLSLPVRTLVKIFYAVGLLAHWINQYLLRVGAMLQGGNFVIRRSAFDQVGGFDPSIEFYGEDTDVARRLARAGRVVWTFRLPMHTSGRRLRAEGVLAAGSKYAANFIWTTFAKRPLTKEYIDIR